MKTVCAKDLGRVGRVEGGLPQSSLKPTGLLDTHEGIPGGMRA